MLNVEIRQVANGWYVMPGYGGARDRGMISDSTDIHVFNTFDGLVRHLAGQSNVGDWSAGSLKSDGKKTDSEEK